MALHDLNTNFTWQPTKGPFTTVTDEQAHRYDEDGYFVLEGAFSRDQIEAVTGAIDPIEHRHEEWLREQGGTFLIARADEITFSTHLAAESERLANFVSDPVLTGLCADLIGPDVRLYWDQAVYKKPHTPSPFPWHQDNGYAFIEPQQYLTCWIALTDADERNGCPWVVPGLHRRGTLDHEVSATGLVCFDQPAGAVAVPAPQGSIVVFSSLTPHCTGPNDTDQVRKAYIIQYAPAGADVVRSVPGGLVRTPADVPDRQFPVLVQGQPVRR